MRNTYKNARSRVGVGCNLRDEFSVKMGVHQTEKSGKDLCAVSLTSRGRDNKSCDGSAMLPRASETWAPTLSDLYRLQRNDQAMIHWICGVTTKDQIN